MSAASNAGDSRLPRIYATLAEVNRDLQGQISSSSGVSRAAMKTEDRNSSADAYQMPHLFLHFDVNETILIGDPAGGDTVEECLNKIIAKSAFVSTKEAHADTNDVNVDTETRGTAHGLTRSPSSGNISTTSTHQVIPTHWWNGQSLSSDEQSEAPPLYTGWTWPPHTSPYYRTSFKKLAKAFTEGHHGSVYKPLYGELCNKLGLKDSTNERENVFANFVPAFFHTLQHYFPSKSSDDIASGAAAANEHLPPPHKVTLVLRTFGTDLPRVARCISDFAKGNHPEFPDYYNSDLILNGDLFCSSWTYRDVHGNVVEKTSDAELVYELHSSTSNKIGEHSQNGSSRGDFCGDDAILDFLQTKSIVGIQDCYPFWRDNNHEPWSGKPVWAKTNTNSFSKHDHHHILLDDNIHNDPIDGAGGIRVPKAVEGEGVQRHTSYESLHGQEALNNHGKHLIRVPTICPLMDDRWFVKKIEEARWKYFDEDVKGKPGMELTNFELVISDRNLSDHDLEGIQLPTSLKRLDLSRNCFRYIPDQVFSLSNLTCLDVSRNCIQGISTSIKHLTNLVILTALSNHLRLRQLPLVELASLRHLRLLDLRFNKKLKRSAWDVLKESLIPNNPHLEILCTVPPNEHHDKETKLSACDRDATLLQSQLEPISTPQLCKRLQRTFGVIIDKENKQAFDRVFVMKTLLECYSKHGPREVRQELGIAVSIDRQTALLKELNAIPWPKTTRERLKIRAEYYMILQKPGSGQADSARTKKETAKLMRYKRLFDLAVETLSEIDPSFAERFTALAVTKNFSGSPHIDTLNVGPFYGMSLGDFSGGGAIAVECSPLLVAEVETKGRLGKVDGRFPHWVTPYVGERYSLIYYVTSGNVEPQTTAIFAPPCNPNWIPPPTFVP